MGNDSRQPAQDADRKSSRKRRLGGLIKSTLGAAIGVQSRDVYEQDFSNKSPLPFIIAGILFTLLFIGSLLLVVNFVLGKAG